MVEVVGVSKVGGLIEIVEAKQVAKRLNFITESTDRVSIVRVDLIVTHNKLVRE